MNSRDVVRRLHAWHEGRPLPSGETRPYHLSADADILIVAFVKMGGESRPWGIAIGKPGETPFVRVVPEGRNRDQVAAMMATVAPTLLKHLRTPGFIGRDPSEPDDLAPLRQVWLPNQTHLEMLHHLAYAYTFTRWGAELRGRLNALGRASSWLFREAQRPGQQHVVVATTALRDLFTFPAEDTRQGHLGFLLAWLDARGNRSHRLAAALDAERHSIATALDPDIERDTLEPLVAAWRQADRADKPTTAKRNAKAIEEALAPELTRRFDLTVKAISLARSDRRRVNSGVASFVTEALKQQWRGHTQIELGLTGADPYAPTFVPPIETDREPRAAASRYFLHVASADFVESVLIHDDRERLADAVADGEALTGEITEVADEGLGKATVPIWVLRQSFETPLRLRPGTRVCQIGLSKRTAIIRSIDPHDDGGWLAELEITNLKTAQPKLAGRLAWAAADNRWKGQQVAFANAPADGISRRKSAQVWNNHGPGAWLTHARPAGPAARPARDDTDDVPAITTVAKPEDLA